MNPSPSLFVSPSSSTPLPLFASWRRWGRLLLCGLCLVYSASCLATAPSQPTQQGPKFSLHNETQCLQFQDRRTGLSFCVPTGTRLVHANAGSSQSDFEVRMSVPQRNIEICLRKDDLPPELPEGALSGRWLLRYVEGYAQQRGVSIEQVKRHILHPKHRQFLRAESAVWAAFSLPQPGPHSWEEVLVLSKQTPPTRYLISIRIGPKERQSPHALQEFLRLFLKQLRLSPNPT